MPPTTTRKATGRFFIQSLPAMSTASAADPEEQRQAMRVAQVPDEIRRTLPEVAVRPLKPNSLGSCVLAR